MFEILIDNEWLVIPLVGSYTSKEIVTTYSYKKRPGEEEERTEQEVVGLNKEALFVGCIDKAEAVVDYIIGQSKKTSRDIFKFRSTQLAIQGEGKFSFNKVDDCNDSYYFDFYINICRLENR